MSDGLSLRSNQQPVPGQRSTSKKTADLDKVYLEPAIWSRDTGQRIPCFDRCQLTITLMSNIKDVCCKLVSVKWSIASLMSSKLEPVIWLRVLVTLAYMKGRTDVRTYVLSYDPCGPARAFIAKLLRKSPYEGVRDGASRAGKSRPALLGSRTALIRGFSQ